MVAIQLLSCFLVNEQNLRLLESFDYDTDIFFLRSQFFFTILGSCFDFDFALLQFYFDFLRFVPPFLFKDDRIWIEINLILHFCSI